MSTEHEQTRDQATNRSLLRWYPVRWRDRYGDELAAMIEDDLEGATPTLRYRVAIARSGLEERMRDAGLVSGSGSPSERVRGGALTVLCAFALFVVSGIGFAKVSEHWDQSIHGGSRHLPAVSFNLLGSLAVACGVAVVIAAVALLPNFVQYLRIGGWQAIRRRVWWAVTATAATGAAIGGLAIWARHLTHHQRNVGLGWYQVAFIIAAILFATTVATWSAVAVATTRRIDIGLSQLKVVGVLAISVAACMLVMTAAAAVWWGSMATTAPWFLTGAPVGNSASPWATNLLVVLIAMAVASGAGVVGSARVLRSWRLLKSA